MGSAESKNGKQISEENSVPKGSIPSTPILTPKTKKCIEMDPRSVSKHISRTPLEVLTATAEKLNNLKENQLHYNGTPISDKPTLLGLDPRSPTADFKRTPITISAEENPESSKKLRNKNLDRVRRHTINAVEDRIPKENSPLSLNIVPPKLLSDTPIKARPEAYKRKSFVGLLETNIDYTETDLDAVQLLINQAKIDTPVKINQDIIDPRSPTIDFLRTPICIPKKTDENEAKEMEDDADKTDNDLSVKEEICSEEILEDLAEESADLKEEIPEEIKLETKEINVEEKVIVPESTEQHNTQVTSPNLTELSIKEKPATAVNITANVKELDKKLTNLIYEDEDPVICPRIVKLKDVTDRSPLKNRNFNKPQNKSIQKMKVSDKPRKSDYSVSKIPVFREKNKKMDNVACENTPPRNDRNLKVKKSDWDNTNQTLFI